MISLDIQVKIHVEYGPLQNFYASIVVIDLTEDTSLLLNPQLHPLLLASKAALSDPDTLAYDQVLLDPDIEEWKKSTHKEITQLESKDTLVEVATSEATPRFFQAHGYFVARELLQESSPSSR